MSETGKTLLIAGGVAVGAYVLVKFMSTPSRTTVRTPTSTLGQVISGIAAVGPSLTNLFGRSSSGSLSSGDKEIFDTVTDKDTGAVDLSGVYDNSGITTTLGGD
jgi:hypothetical protein